MPYSNEYFLTSTNPGTTQSGTQGSQEYCSDRENDDFVNGSSWSTRGWKRVSLGWSLVRGGGEQWSWHFRRLVYIIHQSTYNLFAFLLLIKYCLVNRVITLVCVNLIFISCLVMTFWFTDIEHYQSQYQSGYDSVCMIRYLSYKIQFPSYIYLSRKWFRTLLVH